MLLPKMRGTEPQGRERGGDCWGREWGGKSQGEHMERKQKVKLPRKRRAEDSDEREERKNPWALACWRCRRTVRWRYWKTR